MKSTHFSAGNRLKNLFKHVVPIFILLIFIKSVSAQVAVDLKFYIQGYYIGNNLMTPALYNEYEAENHNPNLNPYIQTEVDNVTIELHDVTSPYGNPNNPTFTGRLHTDGTISCIFNTAPPANYYIVVIHRNALQTWSTDVALSGIPIFYNFSDNITKVYGNNQTTRYFIHLDAAGTTGALGNGTSDGVFKFFSGDISNGGAESYIQDGVVDGNDFLEFDPDQQVKHAGQFPSDLNGDGGIDLIDYIILYESISLGIGSTTP